MENGSDNGGNTHLDIIGTCLDVKNHLWTRINFH